MNLTVLYIGPKTYEKLLIKFPFKLQNSYKKDPRNKDRLINGHLSTKLKDNSIYPMKSFFFLDIDLLF